MTSTAHFQGKNLVNSVMQISKEQRNEVINNYSDYLLTSRINSVRVYQNFLKQQIETTENALKPKPAGTVTPPRKKYFVPTQNILNNFKEKLNITKKLIKVHNTREALVASFLVNNNTTNSSNNNNNTNNHLYNIDNIAMAEELGLLKE